MSRSIASRTCRTAANGVASSSRATTGACSTRYFSARRANLHLARSASGSSYRPDLQADSVDDDLALSFPELFTTLAGLKRDGRRPTASAYGDMIRLAQKHHISRTYPIFQGRDPSTNAPQGSLAWEVAKAALRDAEKGNVALDEAAYKQLINVSRPLP